MPFAEILLQFVQRYLYLILFFCGVALNFFVLIVLTISYYRVNFRSVRIVDSKSGDGSKSENESESVDPKFGDGSVSESKVSQNLPLLRIFMCCVSENGVDAKNLCEKLRTDNYLPWLAEEELLPGHDRVLETANALSNSDFVLILLSKQSIEQSGHMQKEIKMALEISDTHPDGKMYVIPVRLDECEVPPKLAKWQCANLFETNGYQRLLKSLALRSPHG